MTKTADKPRTARINLNVPFWHAKDGHNKAANYAKKAGAYYDWKAKVFYTYAGHPAAKYLARFMAPADRKVYGF